MIYQPKTAMEAVLLHAGHDAVYLAGGTDDLRPGSEGEGKDLIDVNALDFHAIEEKNGSMRIGALCTLAQIAESDLVPQFIREAAKFCASFVLRSSATIGGNIALGRSDSYLAAALAAADAKLVVMTAEGEKEISFTKSAESRTEDFIEYILVDSGRRGSVRRFGNTAASHAALIAAESEGRYAVSVHGSGLVWGTERDLSSRIRFTDDLTGSAEYKKYLTKIVFTSGR